MRFFEDTQTFVRSSRDPVVLYWKKLKRWFIISGFCSGCVVITVYVSCHIYELWVPDVICVSRLCTSSNSGLFKLLHLVIINIKPTRLLNFIFLSEILSKFLKWNQNKSLKKTKHGVKCLKLRGKIIPTSNIFKSNEFSDMWWFYKWVFCDCVIQLCICKKDYVLKWRVEYICYGFQIRTLSVLHYSHERVSRHTHFPSKFMWSNSIHWLKK